MKKHLFLSIALAVCAFVLAAGTPEAFARDITKQEEAQAGYYVKAEGANAEKTKAAFRKLFESDPPKAEGAYETLYLMPDIMDGQPMVSVNTKGQFHGPCVWSMNGNTVTVAGKKLPQTMTFEAKGDSLTGDTGVYVRAYTLEEYEELSSE